MWDSVESLTYWLTIIRWLPVAAGMLTVVAAIAVATVSNRLDTLRAKLNAPRRLSSTQQEEIARKLSAFAGTAFTIRTYNDDEDAVDLMEAINAALVRAKWVGKPTAHIMAFTLVRGVSMEIAPTAARLEAPAKALEAALNACGISASESVNPGVATEANMVTIRVGHKPL